MAIAAGGAAMVVAGRIRRLLGDEAPSPDGSRRLSPAPDRGVPVVTAGGPVPEGMEDELVKALDEAYAMEKQVELLLRSMIRTTREPTFRLDLERHLHETRDHAERVAACLEAHGRPPSRAKAAGTMTTAALKAPLDMARREKGMRNARDGFATEHLEIAAYRLIEALARKANDGQSMVVARTNAEEEERMAAYIAASWSRLVELSVPEDGVR